MLGEPVSGWFRFRLPFSATVRSPCLWGFAPSVWGWVFGCDGDAWLGGFRTLGWITNGPGLLSLSPSASGSWGLFLFSRLFISPCLSSTFHDTHTLNTRLLICAFLLFSLPVALFLFVGFLYFVSQSCTSW